MLPAPTGKSGLSGRSCHREVGRDEFAVTFLCTDIEDTTRLWEQHPQAMKAAVACHDAILRNAVQSKAGVVFRTVGDGICAAFATALLALEAALAGHLALLQGTEKTPRPGVSGTTPDLQEGIQDNRWVSPPGLRGRRGRKESTGVPLRLGQLASGGNQAMTS